MSHAVKTQPASFHTKLTISGTTLLVNGQNMSLGYSSAGMPTVVRTAQAIFDDELTTTQHYWNYPDTGTWDAERNTNEFVAQIPIWAASGIRMIALTMQGGQPWKGYPGLDGFGAGTQPWIVSAFNHDGTLRPAWMARLKRVIDAADAHGMCVNVALFYQAQIGYLTTPDVNTAINVTIDAFVDWIIEHGYHNVLLEIANECDQGNFNATNIDEASVSTLISRAQTRATNKGYTLYVSCSQSALITPVSSIISQSDYIILHGNLPTTNAQTTTLIDNVRATAAYIAAPKPIFFNEVNRSTSVMDASLGDNAGWGFHYLYEGTEGASNDGHGDYLDALQSVPVNWSKSGSSGLKDAFFSHALTVAGPA